MNTLENLDLDLDFEFGGDSREVLLEEARRLTALDSRLGGEPQIDDPAMAAASRLLDQLGRETAEFSAYPDVIELKERHFAEQGLAVPLRFRDLNRQSRFYWLRFPIILHPAENRPFVKLKCGVEFNPGSTDGHLRPRAQMILPDKKFQQLLQANMDLEIKIGEDFEFEVASGQWEMQAGAAKAAAGAGVDAKLASHLGMIAGPFTYRVRKALVEHSGTGTEKVFWRLSDAIFLQEDNPDLIVILQVPRDVDQVRIAAALQACHQFNLLAADLSSVWDYLRERLASFFRAGAPVSDKQTWDITSSL